MYGFLRFFASAEPRPVALAFSTWINLMESIMSSCPFIGLPFCNFPVKMLYTSRVLGSFRKPVAMARCLWETYYRQVGFIMVSILFRMKKDPAPSISWNSSSGVRESAGSVVYGIRRMM